MESKLKVILIGAALLAKKAVEKGLKVPSYVKTSFAPGSHVVEELLAQGKYAKEEVRYILTNRFAEFFDHKDFKKLFKL